MKVLATIWKEFLTLRRDPGGMALIFLMPVLLVTVMSLVEDVPFRDYRHFSFDIVCVNEDHDTLGDYIEQTLASSGSFHLVKEYQGKPLTKATGMDLVSSGRYRAFLYIPAHATQRLNGKTAIVVQSLMSGFGIMDRPERDTTDAVEIKVVFDPVIQINVKQSLLYAIEKIVAGAENKVLMAKFSEQVKKMTGSNDTMPRPDLSKMIAVTSEKSYEGFDELAMNSVQHNVPAWAMFAMFFIVFPLAGNFIKEREDGSLLRMRLIAGSRFHFIAGKYVFHFFVCQVQFVLMLAVGLFLLPLLGLPRLVIGNEILHIALAATCISLAATAYGMAVAGAFRTHQQALTFGAISVVLLAAIGGVWVPVYVLPHALQVASNISPLSWGLELCNDVFLRHTDFRQMLPQVSKLLVFAAACLGLAYFLLNRQNTR
ncbi:MAG: ABC transporter permease [Bacteroidetes bacterium]|nr:ABC transporter permease [Bacteroidota bacterium]